MKTLALCLLLPLCLPLPAVAAQKSPDTVFLEELTWVELRDLIRAGKTSVIIATAGTEQKGPHMVTGQHRFVLEYTTDRIARALGNAFVAPIITYVPEGTWDPPSGHMTKAGTITLPNDRFMALLENAARSLKAGGFKDIILIGDSGGNQDGMRDVAAKLNHEWQGSGVSAHFIGDYYAKSEDDGRTYITQRLGISQAQIGDHAGVETTSEMLFVNTNHVRRDKLVPEGGSPNSGVSGDPTKATAQIGEVLLRMKIDNAVTQIRASVAPTAGSPALAAGTLGAQTFGAPYLEAMTWTEVRDAIQSGKKAVIIPTGGTEQNGPHMVLGKHNYIVTFTARAIAERLGNALIAPTVQYVPEGNFNSANFGEKPGVISNPSPSYDNLLDAAARSLRVHGFTEILLIGDSGGNQQGLTNVANSLNQEWKGTGTRVYALTDYYQKSRVELRAWLLEKYGYDAATAGSHAGITDTSQLLYIFPQGIRRDKLLPNGGGPESGVNGDPTKATAEIGKQAVEFKVNAAIAQYRALKSAP